jgi:hypothetical protein
MKLMIILAAVCLVLSLFLISGQSGCEQKKECRLSLCDCKCHEAGQTPEELTGNLCGINCLGEYNVSGCEYANDMCKEVYANDSDSCGAEMNNTCG